ncbi:MAG: GntR family transcriptional regulator [Roseiflexaceae bacterium]
MYRLDKSDNGKTLYEQLVTYFRERILDGTLPPGSRLPTEQALTQEHQISRNTVRQAMSALVHEGLLERVQGRGTFVSDLLVQRSLPRVAEKRIGVVLSYTGDQLNMEILIGIEQAAKSRGYQVSFSYSEESSTQQARDIERLHEDRVAGLIVFPVSNEEDDPAIARVYASGIPVVLVDRYLPKLATDSVVADNFNGGYRATEHLLILGHTRIGFVHLSVGNLHTTSVHDRWAGYCAALRDHGLPYDETLIFAYPSISGFTSGKPYVAFLSRQDRPSAVFVVTDQQVPVLFQAARRCGLRVPEDLAVVGFDDLNFAAHLSPPLTTVSQPRIDIGLRAGHLLMNRIEGSTEPSRQIVLPTSLVVRESCGARLRIQQSVEGSASK